MSSSHPQVEAYLDDLARMLADIDPGERDDILASVREHLDAEIAAGDGSDAVVNATLVRLGPPEQVAAAARAAGGPGMYAADLTPTHPQSADHPQPAQAASGSGVWARVAVVTTLLATLPFLTLTLLTRTWTSGRAATGAGWPEDLGLFGPHPAEVAGFMILASPLWVVALVCTLVAPGLESRTRALLALSGPTAFIANVLGSVSWSPAAVSAVVSIALIVAVSALVITAARRGWREAQHA